MRSFRKFASCLAVAALAGCAESQEIFRPFDIDSTSLSSDARQRVIISAARGPAGQTRRIVCAEPSPDAVTALAASLGGSLAGKLPRLGGGQVLTPELQLAYQQSLAEQVAYIGVRNSTIQLLRDGLYRACEAYMNGAVGDFGYSLILANYGRLMVALLASEGITRPPFTPATVLGSQATGGAASPAGGQTPTPASTSASGTGTPGAAPGGSPWPSDRSMELATDMILNLADPYRNPETAVIDLTVACFMWAEESPMRTPRLMSEKIREFCNKVFAAAPGQIERVLNRRGAAPTQQEMEVAGRALDQVSTR